MKLAVLHSVENSEMKLLLELNREDGAEHGHARKVRLSHGKVVDNDKTAQEKIRDFEAIR